MARLAGIQERVGASVMEKADAALARDQAILGEHEPMEPEAVAAELGGAVIGNYRMTDDDRWLNIETGEVTAHLPTSKVD